MSCFNTIVSKARSLLRVTSRSLCEPILGYYRRISRVTVVNKRTQVLSKRRHMHSPLLSIKQAYDNIELDSSDLVTCPRSNWKIVPACEDGLLIIVYESLTPFVFYFNLACIAKEIRPFIVIWVFELYAFSYGSPFRLRRNLCVDYRIKEVDVTLNSTPYPDYVSSQLSHHVYRSLLPEFTETGWSFEVSVIQIL